MTDRRVESVTDSGHESSAARIRVFALRRVHGFALIADGFGHIVNLRFGLGLRSAKALAKARNNGR